jgi:hypothetical protein
MDERLTELFYDDTLQGLANAAQLRDYAKANDVQITLAQAKAFIAAQATAQRFKKRRKAKLFIPITAPPWSYQIDTLKLAGKSVIVLIEITSRKVYTAVVRDATADSAAEAMTEMIRKIRSEGNDILLVESDSGGEFAGAFDKMLRKEGVEHYRYPSTDASNTALGHQD